MRHAMSYDGLQPKVTIPAALTLGPSPEKRARGGFAKPQAALLYGSKGVGVLVGIAADDFLFGLIGLPGDGG